MGTPETIPGSSKKTALGHSVRSYATSPPRPLTSMLKLWEFEVPTKMAVFFEGLRHHVWITTLKLGVRGRSWEPWCRNSRWLFFLKNPVKFFWTFHANTTFFFGRFMQTQPWRLVNRATSHATILAMPSFSQVLRLPLKILRLPRNFYTRLPEPAASRGLSSP